MWRGAMCSVTTREKGREMLGQLLLDPTFATTTFLSIVTGMATSCWDTERNQFKWISHNDFFHLKVKESVLICYHFVLVNMCSTIKPQQTYYHYAILIVIGHSMIVICGTEKHWFEYAKRTSIIQRQSRHYFIPGQLQDVYCMWGYGSRGM